MINFWVSIHNQIMGIHNHMVYSHLAFYIKHLVERDRERIHIDGLVQERCNPSALAVKLRLSALTHRYVVTLIIKSGRMDSGILAVFQPRDISI